MARSGAWSTATHRHWPDAFKAAARTLLLAGSRTVGGRAGRRRQSRPVRASRFGALPADVLLRIVQLAAEPMHAWR